MNENKTNDPIDSAEDKKWQGMVDTNIGNIKGDIAEIKGDIKKILDKFGQLEQEVAVLKVKSSVWGFLAGLIPAVVALIYWIVNK